MSIQFLSFLANVGWLVGVVLICGVIFFLGRVLLRRLGRGGDWKAYTRPISGNSVEVGIKRSSFLGLGTPERIPVDTLSSKLMSDDPANLYTLQAKASETAASMNARRDQSDY